MASSDGNISFIRFFVNFTLSWIFCEIYESLREGVKEFNIGVDFYRCFLAENSEEKEIKEAFLTRS